MLTALNVGPIPLKGGGDTNMAKPKAKPWEKGGSEKQCDSGMGGKKTKKRR